MTESRLWILGAPDPEMEMIEALLRECGEQVVHATIDGVRVHAGNAYRCPIPEVPTGSTVYAVECVNKLPEGWISIDHHWPGDPGYGQPPENFMAASSLGQVIAELARLGVLPRTWRGGYGRSAAPGTIYREPPKDAVSTPWCVVVSEYEATHRTTTGRYYDSGWAIEIPTEYMLAAAADHCLAAAYRGECPGVDPDSLMWWRVKTRARSQGRSIVETLTDVEHTRRVLGVAAEGGYCPECEGAGCVGGWEWECAECCGRGWLPQHTVELAPGIEVADIRGRKLPELPEASAREGVAYLATVSDHYGRKRVVLGGAATPEMIREFMDVWAPSQGLVDIYGDPQRGFAGGYLQTFSK